MTTPVPRLQTSELVCLAWIASVIAPYAVASGTTLQGPDATTGKLSWDGGGFVQVSGTGGSPQRHVPLRQPVLSVDCWSTNVGRKQPPWGRANSLAELLVRATFDTNWGDTQRPVTLPTGYGKALVRGAVALTEPTRRPADPANYAHYGFDLELSWLAL